MLVKINKENAPYYEDMVFMMYESGAVSGKASKAVIDRNVERFVSYSDCDGYLIEYQGAYVGYVLLTYMYSTEFGAMDAWLEELYVSDAFQGHGLGTKVLNALKQQLENDYFRIRLEVTHSNERAISLYEKHGFSMAKYDQMVYYFNGK